MFGERNGQAGMWRFETLADCARVLRWLRRKQRRGLTAGLRTYFRHATRLWRDSIDAYERRVEELDRLAGGVFSAPLPGGTESAGEKSLLADLQTLGRELRTYFDTMAAKPDDEFVRRWRGVIESTGEYNYLLQRLVGDFGNFERLLPALPGTGEVVTDPRVQRHIEEMYRINMRNLRVCEMVHDFCRESRRNADPPGFAFFEPHTDLAFEVGRMVTEYLIQADPDRIRARRQAAERKGRPYVPYRFWRASENLRLMGKVEYLESLGRKPVQRRPYVNLRLDACPPICTDLPRLNWALKEIFNNSLSASSYMYVTPSGVWAADPLPRHDREHPSPAIRVALQPVRKRIGWRKRTRLRLTVLDEGVGVDPQHLPYLTYWAYSPRREEFRARAQRAELSAEQALHEIQIGGKGIGLGYAAAVIREHGGELRITSNVNEGTTVIAELPVPTPLKL